MLRNVDTPSRRVASSRCYTTTHMKISSYTFKVNEIRESASKLSRFLSKVSSGFTHTDVEVPSQTMVSRFPSVSPSLLTTDDPACEHDKKTQLGIVLMFRENYPVVSLLEMLKCHLKQLAWQLSRPAVTTPSPHPPTSWYEHHLINMYVGNRHNFCQHRPAVSRLEMSVQSSAAPILLSLFATWFSSSSSWHESRIIYMQLQCDKRAQLEIVQCPAVSLLNMSISRLVIVLHSLSATTISISPSPYTTVCPVVSGLQSGLVLLHPSRIATSIPSISVTWKSSPYTSYAKVTRNIS